ncbi:hypothetical protein BGW80DRAFT_1373551 [Lactifluus volemus]|nr:hypothetical protein BGW80DRAFT_1373551 [Lactifluus volemus]
MHRRHLPRKTRTSYLDSPQLSEEGIKGPKVITNENERGNDESARNHARQEGGTKNG